MGQYPIIRSGFLRWREKDPHHRSYLAHVLLFLVAQSCPISFATPMDCSPPGSSVHGISQARILEWVAISFIQGIFQTQVSSLHLLYWQAGSLPLSHQGSPRVSWPIVIQLLSEQIHVSKTVPSRAKQRTREETLCPLGLRTLSVKYQHKPPPDLGPRSQGSPPHTSPPGRGSLRVNAHLWGRHLPASPLRPDRLNRPSPSAD